MRADHSVARVSSMPMLSVSHVRASALPTEIRLTRVSRMLSVIDSISSASMLLPSDLDFALGAYAAKVLQKT